MKNDFFFYIFSLNGEICKCFDVCKIKFKTTAFNISTELFPLIYVKSVSFSNIGWNFINGIYALVHVRQRVGKIFYFLLILIRVVVRKLFHNQINL